MATVSTKELQELGCAHAQPCTLTCHHVGSRISPKHVAVNTYIFQNLMLLGAVQWPSYSPLCMAASR